MRAALVLASTVACGVACGKSPARSPRLEPAPQPAPQTQGDAASEPAAVGAPPRPPVAHATRAPIEAPHAGAIVSLAVTPDGKSALSCDELDGLRLWPTLDGSHEPVQVELPRPKQLAVGASGDGFTAVVLDEVGGLVIADLDRGGRTRSRVTLAAEPAYVDVAMSELGAVAWRSDQTLELIGADGAIKARLAVEPGERITALSVSGQRALALVESVVNGKVTRRPRWIALGTKLAWGAWIKRDEATSSVIALAPSGARYAVFRADPKLAGIVTVVDAASGDVVKELPFAGVSEIAFADDDHVALATPGTVSWLSTKKSEQIAPQPVTSTRATSLLASGGGRVFSTNNGELVITAPAGPQFLGYGVESPTIAQVAGNGRVLVGVGEFFTLLDQNLRAVATPALDTKDQTVADARWLGGDDWLLVATTADGSTHLSLADLARGTAVKVRDKLSVIPVVQYEPSTHLVTLSLGDTPEVDRYDPGKHALERLAALPKPKGFEQTELVPVSPALARGSQLVRVGVRDRPTIQWLHDAQALGKAASSVTIENASFAGADAAGHVFVWRNTPQDALELAIYVDGQPVGKLPNDGPVALWPDPTGTRVVEVGARAVSLYTTDGKKVWSQELAGTTEALWLSDGAIAIVSAAGIARVDAATGAVTAARCGWRFELSSKPHPAAPQIEPLCTQLAP